MKARLEKSLELNLNWFRKSGVMLPEDGSWGVAERVLLTENNSALDKIRIDFPAWTDHDGKYSIIEQRRADCCMETAFLFMLAGDSATAENIINYLYCRSGMLRRFQDPKFDENEVGAWYWSHTSHFRNYFFDDNSWMCIFQLAVADMRSDLDEKYEMKKWAKLLLDAFIPAFYKRWADGNPCLPQEDEGAFPGRLHLPHWGSLFVFALSRAFTEFKDERYFPIIDRYHDYLLGNIGKFTSSEYAYAILGATKSFQVFGDEKSKLVRDTFGKLLLGKMDLETGNIPAEHYETPVGGKLADTIYTLNWSLLALQNLTAQTGLEVYRNAFLKLLDLLIDIQDTTPEPHLYGCWRGLYDFETRKWGGGDTLEGGAGSIYTGWTNAPISIGILNELNNKSLLDY